MGTSDVVVVAADLAVAAGLGWWFFGPKRTTASALEGGVQTVRVTVRGGYNPNRISARAGVPLRLIFDRQESGDCTSRVVFPDLSVSAELPGFAETTVEMLTGDPQRTADAVARRVGIDKVLAEVRPEGKTNEIARLQAEGRSVGMVGDGINDAPALAKVDVGLAICTGTDVTLMSGSLLGIATTIRLSQATMRNIRQNLALAFGYNTAGIPLAAGLLYPFFGIVLSPMIAAAAMALSSLSVITNANRLRHTRITPTTKGSNT